MEQSLLDTLIKIAQNAGRLVLEVYNQDEFDVNIKSDNSPLTEADKKSHNYITTELKKYFPHIPTFSEEGEEISYEQRKDWKEFFLVDPLDGTRDFIKRNDEFTVNIALIKNQQPFAGVIYVPVTRETYYGSVDKGSYKKLNGKTNKINVSKSKLEDELKVVQSRNHAGEEEKEFYSKFKIKENVSKGSSLKICLVAEGAADLYFRGGPTWEWDTAAGHAILISAGGYFINKDGSGIIYNKRVPKNYGFIASSFIISNSKINKDG
jgi:3'(2'), 5'-bisphosphate nucleotidase